MFMSEYVDVCMSVHVCVFMYMCTYIPQKRRSPDLLWLDITGGFELAYMDAGNQIESFARATRASTTDLSSPNFHL